MKKFSILLIISILGFIFVLVSAYSQEDMQFVDNSDFKKPARPPAVFKHEAHNESAGIEECNTCHHVYQDGKLVPDESSEDQRCADCHRQKSSDGQPSLRNAFHLRCQGCHLKLKKGPIMCGECHQKS